MFVVSFDVFANNTKSNDIPYGGITSGFIFSADQSAINLQILDY
jgi:hypothetical protein